MDAGKASALLLPAEASMFDGHKAELLKIQKQMPVQNQTNVWP
jgi:hypothetical protein